MNISHHSFQEILEGIKNKKNIKHDTDLTLDDLKLITSRYAIYLNIALLFYCIYNIYICIYINNKNNHHNNI